jgi:glycosyltransferase involved in cell wall biosynthesis
MRILLISPCFPPLHAVASLRTYGFARAWVRTGCQVTVLTTTKRPDQSGLRLPLDGIEVVEVAFRVPELLEKLRSRHKKSDATMPPNSNPVALSRPSRPSLLTTLLRRLRERTGIFSAVRMPDLTDFWVKPALAWARTQSGDPSWDVIVSSAGPYTAHLVGWQLRREGRAPFWVADFRDLWTENHIFPGLFPFTVLERFHERRVLREADLLATVTEELAGKLRARTRRPVEVIYNGYDPDSLRLLSSAPFFPEDGVCRLVYPGTWYPQGQDPTPLLRALHALRTQRPDLAGRFALVVAGWSGPQWRDLAGRHGVGDLVQVLGVLSHEETLRLERDASALLLLDWHDPTQGVLTGKVFEYLSAPGPILAVGGAADSALAQLLRRTGRGFHLGNDEGCIIAALEDLLDRPEQLRLIPNAAVLAELTRSVQSLRLLKRIRRAIEPPGDIPLKRAG